VNIFVLDENPRLCAQQHIDKHVVKMPLETAQMLCTAILVRGGEAVYKMAHKNHPCSIWARENRNNFLWLVELGWELCLEYQFRYGKVHKCLSVINDCLMKFQYMPDGGPTDFVQAMPEEYKRMDPVAAYRAYYVGAKVGFASWKNRKPPEWFCENIHMEGILT
jgi:hypothetical protein